MSHHPVSVASLVSLVVATTALVGCGSDADAYHPAQVLVTGGQAGAGPVGQAGAATAGGQGGMAPAPVEVNDCIVGLRVERATTSAVPQTLDGYQLLNQDLNAGAGGDFMYVYYKLGPDDGSQGACITRIYTIDTTDGEANIPGGTSIGVDLNATVGGDYIYLGFLQEAGAEPIRSIVTFDREAAKYTFSAGGGVEFEYSWAPQQGMSTAQDLNEGAGGHFVYIGYTTDFVQ
jgi:hypothetical protein